MVISQNANVEDVRKWREAEIKHGRLAMLAALGIIVGEEVEFSTPLFGDLVTGPAIYQVSKCYFPPGSEIPCYYLSFSGLS